MKFRKNPEYIFFGLLINPRIPSLGWSSTWYQLKLSFYYFKRFFYDIWWFRGSDRGYTYTLLETALKEHLRVISTEGVEGLDEVDETRIPKENAIKRCLELLHNIQEDNYIERCGFDHDYDFYFTPIEGREGWSEMHTTDTPEQKENNSKAIKEGQELAEKELNEFFNILRDPQHGIQTWWK